MFNSTSQQDTIFLSTAKSALDSLLRYGDWQELTKEGVLRTSGQKEKYLMDEICPDFFSIFCFLKLVFSFRINVSAIELLIGARDNNTETVIVEDIAIPNVSKSI